MYKKDMLFSIAYRLNTLSKRYVKAVENKDEFDNDITKGAAAAIRTQSKRDIQLLIMFQKLLEKYPEDFIEDRDIITGVERLAAPYERYRRYK